MSCECSFMCSPTVLATSPMAETPSDSGSEPVWAMPASSSSAPTPYRFTRLGMLSNQHFWSHCFALMTPIATVNWFDSCPLPVDPADSELRFLCKCPSFFCVCKSSSSTQAACIRGIAWYCCYSPPTELFSVVILC